MTYKVFPVYREEFLFPFLWVLANISKKRMMTTQKGSSQLASGRHTAWGSFDYCSIIQPILTDTRSKRTFILRTMASVLFAEFRSLDQLLVFWILNA